jgi:hypothetical protein
MTAAAKARSLYQPPVRTCQDACCTVHYEPYRRKYTFAGGLASVTTFACGCAAVFAEGAFTGTLWPSYEQAAGQARRIVREALEPAF